MRPGQISSLHRLNNALLIMNATASLLDEWPRRFHELLERLRDAKRDSKRLGIVYGRLYRSIYHDLPDHGYHFLRTAFEAYLNERWPGILAKRNRRLRAITVAQHQMLPLGALARITKSSKATIKHLAAAGAVDGTAINHKSGRTSWAFPQGAVAVTIERISDSMTLLEARRTLGLTKSRLHELIDAGLIRAWVNPRRRKSAIWALSRKDIRAVLEMGVVAAVPESCSDGQGIALRQVLQTWQLRKGEFPSLIQAIWSERLSFNRFAPTSNGIGNGCLIATDLRSWIASIRADSRMTVSIDQAAAMLGLKQQVVYELARGKFLATEICQTGDLPGRRVTQSAIADFQRDYVALTSLARDLGVSVRRTLNEIATPPACGPRVDGTRQYFYRRSELPTRRASAINERLAT
jgi:hypothetical protein